MATYAKKRPSKHIMPKKIVGIHEVDTFSAPTAQVATLSKQITFLIANKIHTPREVCNFCNRPHSSAK